MLSHSATWREIKAAWQSSIQLARSIARFSESSHTLRHKCSSLKVGKTKKRKEILFMSFGWFHSCAVENSVLLGYDAVFTDVSKETWIRKFDKSLPSVSASYRRITKALDNYLLQCSLKKMAIYIEFWVCHGVVHGMFVGNMLPNCEVPTCHIKLSFTLTLNPLTWKIWWAPNDASRWQMGFNSAFKELTFIWAKYEFVDITAPSNINSQPDATIKIFIDNYKQLNMFRAIISPILRNTRLCLQLVV